MTHILLVEDNKRIGSNTKTYLESEGFVVQREEDGADARDVFQKKTFDCVLLDIMLPGIDGIELCKHMRSLRTTPIIMTTAKGQLEDKGESFQYGADDYLVKPFALEELVMRIRALLKRAEPDDIVRLGDIELFLEDNRVTRQGKDIHLTTKEFLILSILTERMPHVVSRTDIVEFVRGGESVWDNDAKLDVYIANLRKKLGKELIETIKGVGYKIKKQLKNN